MTTDNIAFPAETDIFPAPSEPTRILMRRDPDRGGLGVTRMFVPLDEVELFEKSGWFKDEA